MTRITVLFSLLLAVAMSAAAGGIRDLVDADLTDEVEGMLDHSALREYAGLEPTPIPTPDDVTPPPVPVDRIPTEVRSGVPTGIPIGGTAQVGTLFIEIPLIPLIVEDRHAPLTDLDALYGVHGHGTPTVPALPDPAAPPALLVDDTPVLVAWGDPPPDAK